jgi:hypothetical protein
VRYRYSSRHVPTVSPGAYAPSGYVVQGGWVTTWSFVSQSNSMGVWACVCWALQPMPWSQYE